jgi:hypothetical protein
VSRRRKLLWVFGGLACVTLLVTLLQYNRLAQLYFRHRLEWHPEEVCAYALSNDGNKREAIRLFAMTPEGGKRTASVLIQTLCDGVVRAANGPAMCSRESSAGGVCDMEFYIGQIPSMNVVMIEYEEFLWDFSRQKSGTTITDDVLQCAGVLLSALSGTAVQIESTGNESTLILEVEKLAADVKTELIIPPLFPYHVRLRADDREKLNRCGEVLMDNKGLLTRTRRMRAAEALGKLSTPEAISVLQDVLALDDDLERHLRAVVEKALDEALARRASENRD